VSIQEQVFWLEVAVDDALAVEVGERLQHAARVEPRRRVVKRTPATFTRRLLEIVSLLKFFFGSLLLLMIRQQGI